MAVRSLRDWRPGDDVYEAAHHQQVIDALREMGADVGYGDPGAVGDHNGPRPVEKFPVILTDEGPPAEEEGDPREDYDDARYWAKRAYVGGAKVYDAVELSEDKAVEAYYGTEPAVVTVTNLPERSAGSHLLPVDGTTEAWCWAWYDRGNPQRKHYFISVVPPRVRYVTLTQDGGSDGDASAVPPTACTYTYSMDGGALGENQTPARGRLFKMSYTVADRGVAVLNADGDAYELWDCNEVASDQYKCPEADEEEEGEGE